MFDEGTGAEWVCHRHADIRLPLRDVIAHTPSGLPYLRPEIQLLLKAKGTRPKDDADFALVFPLLTPEAGAVAHGSPPPALPPPSLAPEGRLKGATV